MGHGRHITSSSPEVVLPAVPIADYHINFDINIVPDCSCNYYAAGMHNGFPYYRRADGAFYIYRRLGENPAWIIADVLDKEDDLWEFSEPPIIGTYSDVGEVSGNPEVAAGPH